MTMLFAIGGGSDYFSAQLIRLHLGLQDWKIFTSLSPLYTNGAMDVNLTIAKYQSRPEFRLTEWPLFADTRSENAFGLVVPSDPESLAKLCEWFISKFPTRCECIAIDTGGDSLRGRVPGMGNHDISHLFSNICDERDISTLNLIRLVWQTPLALYVIGPGSDGESLDQDIHSALSELRAKNIPNVSLVREGSVADFVRYFGQVSGWQNPIPGSTIANIVKAIDSPNEESVTIVRRNVDLFAVSTKIISSYWILEVT